MYGMIFKAVEGLVRRAHGESTWLAICSRAGRAPEPFVSLHIYPDELLESLVLAASAELGVEPADVLRGFGRYWMEYTAAEGYGGMLDTCGSTFEEFLSNLDDLHTRIRLLLPQLDPPAFEVDHAPDGRLQLHYRSRRAGFTPVVEGVLEGLAERFGLKLDVQWEARAVAEGTYSVFLMRLEPRVASDCRVA